MQKVQYAAAGFECNKYGKIDGVAKLNQMPSEQRICMNIAKLAYKGPHERNFRDHLKLCHKIIT